MPKQIQKLDFEWVCEIRTRSQDLLKRISTAIKNTHIRASLISGGVNSNHENKVSPLSGNLNVQLLLANNLVDANGNFIRVDDEEDINI